MHLQEFKAWFDGFCDGLDGPPTGEQFEKLKTKIEQFTTPRAFVSAGMPDSLKQALSEPHYGEIIPF